MADMPSAPVPSQPVAPTNAAPADLKGAFAPKADAPKAPAAPTNAAPAAQAADKKEVAEAIQKIKLKDAEYTPAELEAFIEKAKGADKKFLEAAKARKEAIKFFKMAKENPEEVLSKVGQDPMKWAYEKVAKDVQDKLRDPKEVELERAQKELERYKAQEAERQAKLKADQEEKQAAAWRQKFEAEIIDALETTPTLPKNPHTVAQIARYIATVKDKTGVLLSAKEVASVVENDIRNTMKSILTNADAKKIMDLIGEEGMKMIREYDLAQLKNPLKQPNSAAVPGSQPTEDSNRDRKGRYKRAQDFWKDIPNPKIGM